MDSYAVTIAMIGATGSGKSRACQVLTGNDDFKDSDGVQPMTLMTTGGYGTFNDTKLFCIDTPGLFDNGGLDASHIKEFTNYVAGREVNGICVVINAAQVRFDENVQKMFGILHQIFPTADFWHHICLLFTHADDRMAPSKRDEFSAAYVREVNKMIHKMPGTNVGNVVLRSFFMDVWPGETQIGEKSM